MSVYFLAYLSIQLAVLVFFSFSRAKEENTEQKKNSQIFVSVLIPMHNEEDSIESTLRSIFEQDYDSYEIVLVNDGSEDGTLQLLLEGYCFKQTDDETRCLLSNAKIKKIYAAMCDKVPMYLIDKENSGKGDSLNAAVSFAHASYVLCMDADCLLEKDALRRITASLSRYPQAAIGGRIEPIPRKRESVIEILQKMEYHVTFLLTREFVGKLGATMIISGAFGLFERQMILAVGGYATDTCGEDMELVQRLRKYSLEQKSDCKFLYAKDAICKTQVPFDRKSLTWQRARWHRGLVDVLGRYKEMAYKKEYSLALKLVYWYELLWEELSPVVGVVGVLIMIPYMQERNFKGLLLMWLVFVVVQILEQISVSRELLQQIYTESKSKLIGVLRIFWVFLLKVLVYHTYLCLVRLFAGWILRDEKHKAKGRWDSPKRRRENGKNE